MPAAGLDRRRAAGSRRPAGRLRVRARCALAIEAVPRRDAGAARPLPTAPRRLLAGVRGLVRPCREFGAAERGAVHAGSGAARRAAPSGPSTTARRGRAPLDPLPGRPQPGSGADRSSSSTPSTTCRSSIATGETLGLVGECGSGKTTFGRAVLRRHRPVEGTIRFDGADITHTTGEQLRALRRECSWCSRTRTPASTRG